MLKGRQYPLQRSTLSGYFGLTPHTPACAGTRPHEESQIRTRPCHSSSPPPRNQPYKAAVTQHLQRQTPTPTFNPSTSPLTQSNTHLLSTPHRIAHDKHTSHKTHQSPNKNARPNPHCPRKVGRSDPDSNPQPAHPAHITSSWRRRQHGRGDHEGEDGG